YGNLPDDAFCLDDDEFSREVGYMRPLAGFDRPDLSPLLKYGVNDLAGVADDTKSIEVIEQRRDVVHGEADALNARRSGLDMCIAYGHVVRKYIGIVMGRSLAPSCLALR